MSVGWPNCIQLVPFHLYAYMAADCLLLARTKVPSKEIDVEYPNAVEPEVPFISSSLPSMFQSVPFHLYARILPSFVDEAIATVPSPDMLKDVPRAVVYLGPFMCESLPRRFHPVPTHS